MKLKNPILYLIILFASLSCERDAVEPVDIFATEDPHDAIELNLGNDTGIDKLFVNPDRITETADGYHIKGTVFSQSLSGMIPVTSGDFLIKTSINSEHKGAGGFDFSGYGTAMFPTAGLFSASDVGEIPGSDVYYNTGKIFKSESKISLPLADDRFYFRYRLDKAGKGKEYRMKKITVKLKEYYLDGRDPAALFTGDIYTEKSGTKRLILEQGVAGISANELWQFIPYEYSENLEKITGGTGFVPMNGGLTFSGIIPIKKYPVKILGEAVLNTSFSSAGPLDFFERGFDDASFRMGVNGKLFFSNELVTFLTGVDTVSLGKATLQAEFSDDDFSIRMAGEYSDNILERFLGSKMMSFIPSNSREGVMYLRGTEDPDDFIIYLEESISLQIPGLGSPPLANSVFRITKNEVGLSGTLDMPYNIGNVDVAGVLRADGTFVLKGSANCNIDLGQGLIYNADLEAEVTERGVALKGSIALPYGIGDVSVEGGILQDELFFSGLIASDIPFPVNASVRGNLQVSLSSKTGILLSGSLNLPGGIGNVSVEGVVNTRELLMTGRINSGVTIDFGSAGVTTGSSLSLTASSLTGVIMSGSVSLPCSLGAATASLRVISGGVSMTGDLGSSIRISGYPLFNADMSVSASTGGGMWLSGTMKFPGNFGWTAVSGSVTYSGYNLTGDVGSSTIDFGIVSLSTDFRMRISSSSGIVTTASGRGCVGVDPLRTCATVGVDVDIDYYDNSIELCMDFPVVGSACVGW